MGRPGQGSWWEATGSDTDPLWCVSKAMLPRKIPWTPMSFPSQSPGREARTGGLREDMSTAPEFTARKWEVGFTGEPRLGWLNYKDSTLTSDKRFPSSVLQFSHLKMGICLFTQTRLICE